MSSLMIMSAPRNTETRQLNEVNFQRRYSSSLINQIAQAYQSYKHPRDAA